MKDVLYDLFFMLPLDLVLNGLLIYLGVFPEGIAPYAVSVVVLAVFLSWKYLSGRKKLLPPGMLLMLLIGAFLIIKPEDRLPLILGNTWVVWGFVLAGFVYGTGRLAVSHRNVQRILLLASLLGLPAMMFAGYPAGKTDVAVLVWLFLICMIQEIEHRWKRSGDTDRKGHLIYIFPFPLLVSLIVFFHAGIRKTF